MTLQLSRQWMASFLVVVLALGIVASVPPQKAEASWWEVGKFVLGVVVGIIASWEAEPLRDYYDAAKDSVAEARSVYNDYVEEHDVSPILGCSSNRCIHYLK